MRIRLSGRRRSGKARRNERDCEYSVGRVRSGSEFPGLLRQMSVKEMFQQLRRFTWELAPQITLAPLL